MGEIRFEPETHSYWAGDRRLPGITEILAGAGIIQVNPAASPLKGTAVHLATALWDRGETAAAEEIAQLHGLQGHLKAWCKAKEALNLVFTHGDIEVPRGDAVLGFGGTPDRANTSLVVEIKTGHEEPWHRVQTAAQRILLGGNRKRMAVYLAENGSFKVICHDLDPQQWDYQEDRKVFLNALSIANWRIKLHRFWSN